MSNIIEFRGPSYKTVTEDDFIKELREILPGLIIEFDFLYLDDIEEIIAEMKRESFSLFLITDSTFDEVIEFIQENAYFDAWYSGESPELWLYVRETNFFLRK
ncbi:hypothetical protein AMR41_11375 [Hapalosiphon sp. MRB220]|nr:hypothetical protein AMR41_11375 [Hapalosiphon sp. MRB220]